GYCYDKLKNPAQARFYYRKTSHLRPEDSKLYYKIACTYIHEKQWSQAVKQLETALQGPGRSHPEYCLAMGECMTELGNSKEAILYFSRVVELRPKNIVGWEAIIRCMYRFGFYEEAREHANAALRLTEGKPLFVYYLSAICFALGKPKEAVILLEKAFMLAPKMLKRFIALDPSLLQKQQVIELMARYKKRK